MHRSQAVFAEQFNELLQTPLFVRAEVIVDVPAKVILAEIVCGKLFQTLSGKGDAGRRLQERQHVRGDKESDRADSLRPFPLECDTIALTADEEVPRTT